MLSEKPWRVDLVILLIGALLLSWNLCMAAAAALHHAKVPGFANEEGFGFVLLGTLSFHGAGLILMPFFLHAHGIGFRDVFNKPGTGRSLLLAAGVITALLPVAFGLEIASAFIMQKCGWQVEDEAAVKLAKDANTVLRIVYMGGFAIVLAPIVEEFIFRGVLFSFAKQLGHRKFAWFGVSALFALVHLNAPAFVPLFVLALGLTWLYEKTGNLLASIFAHSLFNIVGFLIIEFRDRLPDFIK